MKKTIALLLLTIMCVTLFTACNQGYDEPPVMGFLTAGQFTGYKLGTVPELVPETVLTENIDSPIVVKLSSVEDGLRDLLDEKIYGLALPAIYMVNETEKNDSFEPTRIPFIEKRLCAISLNGTSFVVPADATITSLQNNGTARKIAEAYSIYANEEDPYVRPTDYDKLDGRTITFGICSDDAAPYNYHDENGVLTGINVDIAYEIAKGVHADIVIKEYPEDKLMDALDAGEVDMILSQFHEDENAPLSQDYLYSHSYCDASTYIVIRSAMAELNEKLAAKGQ